MTKLKSLILGLALVLGIAGCGGSSQPLSPSAYGVNGQCFYVQSPFEVVALQNAGLCPRTWAAYPMPGYWHDEYYSYYASPRYYNHYAPVQARSSWKSQQKAYYAPRKSIIQKAQAAVAKAKPALQKVTSQLKTKPKPAAPVPKPANPYTDKHKPAAPAKKH